MWPFKEKPSPVATPDPAISDFERRRVIAEKTMADIDDLALLAEKEANTQRENIIKRVKEEHEADCLSYEIKVSSHGDFLSLIMERDNYKYDKYEGKYILGRDVYVTSINMRDVREVRFVEGNTPDENGVLHYHVRMEGDDGHSFSWGNGYGRFPAPAGFHYSVTPDYPPTEPDRPVFYMRPSDEKEDHHLQIAGESYKPTLRTPNYPRAAKDDQIQMIGINATIFIPAGLGRDVYENILQTLGRGASHATTKGTPE